jgi:hypothetical protein
VPRILLFVFPILIVAGGLFAIAQIPSDAHGVGFIGLVLIAIGLGNVLLRRRHAKALLRIQPGLEKTHWRGERGIAIFYGGVGLACFVLGIAFIVKFR